MIEHDECHNCANERKFNDKREDEWRGFFNSISNDVSFVVFTGFFFVFSFVDFGKKVTVLNSMTVKFSLKRNPEKMRKLGTETIM